MCIIIIIILLATVIVDPVLLYYTIMCIDKHLWIALQERFSRPGLSGSICDVYDGQFYQKRGFLSHPANVTLLLNTDGVSVFRSSKSTLLACVAYH